MEKIEIRGVLIGLVAFLLVHLAMPLLISDSQIYPGPLHSLMSTTVWLIPGLCAGWNSRRHPIVCGVVLGAVLALYSFVADELFPSIRELDALVASLILIVPDVTAASALGFLLARSRNAVQVTH